MSADLINKQLDSALNGKQSFWETPRNIVFIVGTATAVAAAISGWAGYTRGTQSAPTIIFQPGSIQVIQAPAPAPTK